ncbi:MAG: inositol monophosphatase [Sphingobium sp.]|nr:inositol monophosphatase [Sphingobium sp.]
MTISSLTPLVADLLHTVSEEIILPRYQRLDAQDIEEKAKDDLVTVADKESEIFLAEGLARLLPDARIIGEEACAANPALLDEVGTGLCWIIDPIDGTGNFAAGRPPFGVMIALTDGTETLGGWIYDPLTKRLCHAVHGEGAAINGVAVKARGSGEALPIAGISTLFLAGDERAEIIRRAEGRLRMVDIPRCAAEQYPRIALGVNDVALFHRTLPWDHAAGALFLTEAGGRVARYDSSPYHVGTTETGMLGAASPALWDQVAEILFH